MALCALAMVGCNRGYKFEVVANIGYPDVMYYLSPEAQPSTYYMSAKSDAEGVVRFEGKSEVPMAVCLSDGLVNLAGPFFLEEGTISVERLADNSRIIVGRGTPSNEAYCKYLMNLQQLDAVFDTVTNVEAAEARMVAMFDSLDVAVEQANYDNIFGLYLFVKDGIGRYSTRAEVDSVVSLFAPELREHPYMVDALKNFEELK